MNFLHLCDAASIDNFGKISILGIFTKMFLPKVPSKFLKFTVVGNLVFGKLPKTKLTIEIKILGPSKQEVKIKPPITLEFSIPESSKEKGGDVNLILDLGNLEFTNFGEHNLILYVDKAEIGRKNFLVDEQLEGSKS